MKTSDSIEIAADSFNEFVEAFKKKNDTFEVTSVKTLWFRRGRANVVIDYVVEYR